MPKNIAKKKLTKKENIFRLHLIEIVSQKFHSILNNKKKIHKKYYPRFYIQNILHIFHKHIYEYQDFMGKFGGETRKKNIIKMSGG